MTKKRLCDGHYQRVRKTGSVGSATFNPKRKWDVGALCSVTTCDRPVVAHGICAPHFYRQHLGGDLKSDVPIWAPSPPGTACRADGCLRPIKANGNCASHERKRRAALIKADPVKLEAERRYQREFKAAEYKRDPERVRARSNAWRRANPGRLKLSDATKRHKRRQAPWIPFGPDQLAAKLRYWGDRCWICHVPYTAVDHVKPLSRGGWHALANLRPICRSCNSRKSNKWPYPVATTSLRSA